MYGPTTARSEAAGLLARSLSGQRGQHRITIDPAAANGQMSRSYAKPRSRPAGLMRQYERGSGAASMTGCG
jgi:aminoglycoside 6'-N-acetyltransferase